VKIRQDTLVDGDIIYPPRGKHCRRCRVFQRLDAGDLVLTGTPVGTAISAPPQANRGSSGRCSPTS